MSLLEKTWKHFVVISVNFLANNVVRNFKNKQKLANSNQYFATTMNSVRLLKAVIRSYFSCNRSTTKQTSKEGWFLYYCSYQQRKTQKHFSNLILRKSYVKNSFWTYWRYRIEPLIYIINIYIVFSNFSSFCWSRIFIWLCFIWIQCNFLFLYKSLNGDL